MPVYEYKCNECGGVLSLMRKMGQGAEDLICPSCGGKEMHKLLSATNVGASSKAFECPSGSCGMGMPGGMPMGGCPGSHICGSGCGH